MTINTQQIASILRQAAAIAVIVVTALDTISMPTAVRASLGTIAGALIVVEHYVGDSSTGTPPAPTVTTTTTAALPSAGHTTTYVPGFVPAGTPGAPVPANVPPPSPA